jgi:WD40 repeat protein
LNGLVGTGVYGLIFTSVSDYLAGTDDAGTLKVWDPTTGNVIQSIQVSYTAHHGPLSGVNSYVEDIYALDASSTAQLSIYNATAGTTNSGGFTSSNAITLVKADLTNNIAACLSAGSDANKILIFQPSTSTLTQTLTGHTGIDQFLD